jgi:monoterpene epsilon-lactone hydrolase
VPSPEHERLVATLIAAGGGAPATPTRLPPPERMAAMRQAEQAKPVVVPQGVAATRAVVGGVDCLIVEARGAATRRQIIYTHGGGYIWGSPQGCSETLAAFALTCGARVVSPDYRLAPEAPFPAPVEDLMAVYEAMLATHDARDIVFAGDSAGGGLAIVGALAAQARGLAQPGAILAYSPWTDLKTTGASTVSADDPLVDAAGLRMMAQTYLAGADAGDPLASPLYASDAALAALPPVLVQVGTREALLDDARRFAVRARAAGCAVELVEHAGVVHMWLVMAPKLPESIEAVELAAAFLARVALS